MTLGSMINKFFGMFFRRRAGVLLHISSLPSKYGIGDLGPDAYRFVDFLHCSGLTIWQILPLNPTSWKFWNSPYHPLSSFGGNYIFISPEKLFESGLIEKDDLERLQSMRHPDESSDRVDYNFAYSVKRELLRRSWENFSGKKNATMRAKYELFCDKNEWWLEDYALFQSLRESSGAEWHQWDKEIKFRRELKHLRNKLSELVEFFKFEQFIFFEQWFELKNYANSKGVIIMGDIPIYPSYDSQDVWCNPEIFKLDDELRLKAVAGVPPDFFSETGQLWGNPVYDWDKLERDDFEFWKRRLAFSFMLYDVLRLDHFRGFIAYWEVPFGEKTAVNGIWVRAPAEKFFSKILSYFDRERIVVEDLGFITDDVRYIRDFFGFAGMRVLEFAFYEKNSEHLPHNHVSNSVCYTGTHDNPPAKLWFREIGYDVKRNFFSYIGREIGEEEVCLELIRLAFSSVAKYAIAQMQDFIEDLGRMNIPATIGDNWLWKLSSHSQYERISDNIRALCETYGRTI